MREILFRGRISGKTEFVYGSYVKLPNGQDAILSDRGYAIVNQETVGQYTGLTDKNGRKIFEGDIIAYYGDTPEEPELSEIKFLDGAFCNEVPGFDDCEYLSVCCHGQEIVGNIHDNPEMMA